MGKAMRIAGVVSALVLCAASATGFRESYKETNLGGGQYMIVVEVNKHTSAATARQYAFQRAAEVCGAGGFTPLGADGNTYAGPTIVTTHRIGNVDMTTANQTGGGSDFTLLYACNRGVGASQGGYGQGVPRAEDLPRQ